MDCFSSQRHFSSLQFGIQEQYTVIQKIHGYLITNQAEVLMLYRGRYHSTHIEGSKPLCVKAKQKVTMTKFLPVFFSLFLWFSMFCFLCTIINKPITYGEPGKNTKMVSL